MGKKKKKSVQPAPLSPKKEVQNALKQQENFNSSSELLPIPSQVFLPLSEWVYLRTFAIISGFLLFLYLLYSLSSVLTLIFFALLLAYLTNPLVEKMQKMGSSRIFSITMLVLLISFVGVMLVILLLPALNESLRQLGTMATKFPELVVKAKIWLQAKLNVHFPKTWTEAFIQWGDQIKTYAPKAIKPVSAVVATLFSSGYNFLLTLFHLFLVPLFTFYFLKDFHSIQKHVFKYVPPRYRLPAKERLTRIDLMVSGFVHGQITVSLIVGTLYMILLTSAKVPLAPAIAIGGALINVVPYLGFMFTFAVALTAVLIEMQSAWQLLVVFFGMGCIHLIDIFLVTPKVVGEKVGLSELVVIVAVLAGGNLFGFLGVLLAIPSAAILKVLLEDVIRKYKQTAFFQKGMGADDVDSP